MSQDISELTLPQQLEAIELSTSRANEVIELARKLEILRDDPNWVALVEKNYLEDESIRLVHLKGDPNAQDEAKQRDIDLQIAGIGSFCSYLIKLEMVAVMAKKQLMDNASLVRSLLAEDKERELEEGTVDA